MKTRFFISLKKLRKLQHLLSFLGFQWPNDRLKMVSASPNDQKYPRYRRVLKLNVTLARPLRLVILYFLNGKSCQMIGVCIFMTANETRDQMWMASPIQNNC